MKTATEAWLENQEPMPCPVCGGVVASLCCTPARTFVLALRGFQMKRARPTMAEVHDLMELSSAILQALGEAAKHGANEVHDMDETHV